jgi:hypothetical protein
MFSDKPFSIGKRLIVTSQIQIKLKVPMWVTTISKVEKDGSLTPISSFYDAATTVEALDSHYFIIIFNNQTRVIKHDNGHNPQVFQILKTGEVLSVNRINSQSFLLKSRKQIQIYRLGYLGFELTNLFSVHDVSLYFLLPPSPEKVKIVTSILKDLLTSLPLDVISQLVEFISEYSLPLSS